MSLPEPTPRSLFLAGNICCTTELNSSWPGDPSQKKRWILSRHPGTFKRSQSVSVQVKKIYISYVYIGNMYIIKVIYTYIHIQDSFRIYKIDYNGWFKIFNTYHYISSQIAEVSKPNACSNMKVVECCGRSRREETNEERAWNHHKNP